ncbi:hypothetical protein Tco_0448738 [Tanacetum coccineum]
MHPNPTPSSVDPPVSESAQAPSVVVTSSGPTVDLGQSSTATVVTQGMGPNGSHYLAYHLDPTKWCTPVLSPIIEEETGGGPVFESPLRSPHVSPPVTPPVSTTEGVVGDPVTLTSLSLLVNSLVQKVSSLENAILTDATHGKVIIKPSLIKSNVLEDHAKSSCIEIKREAKIFYSLYIRLPSISAERVADSAERMDTADDTISADEDVVSAAVGIPAESFGLATSNPHLPLFSLIPQCLTATVAHPSISFAPSTIETASSPLRDPTKGKGVAEPTSPIQSLTTKELEDQHAAILEAERQEAFEMECHDRAQCGRTAVSILGCDVNDDKSCGQSLEAYALKEERSWLLRRLKDKAKSYRWKVLDDAHLLDEYNKILALLWIVAQPSSVSTQHSPSSISAATVSISADVPTDSSILAEASISTDVVKSGYPSVQLLYAVWETEDVIQIRTATSSTPHHHLRIYYYRKKELGAEYKQYFLGMHLMKTFFCWDLSQGIVRNLIAASESINSLAGEIVYMFAGQQYPIARSNSSGWCVEPWFEKFESYSLRTNAYIGSALHRNTTNGSQSHHVSLKGTELILRNDLDILEGVLKSSVIVATCS